MSKKSSREFESAVWKIGHPGHVDRPQSKPAKKKRSWVGRIVCTLIFLAVVHFFNGGFAGEPIESVVPYVVLGAIGFFVGWRMDKNDEYVFGPKQGQKRDR